MNINEFDDFLVEKIESGDLECTGVGVRPDGFGYWYIELTDWYGWGGVMILSSGKILFIDRNWLERPIDSKVTKVLRSLITRYPFTTIYSESEMINQVAASISQQIFRKKEGKE